MYLYRSCAVPAHAYLPTTISCVVCECSEERSFIVVALKAPLMWFWHSVMGLVSTLMLRCCGCDSSDSMLVAFQLKGSYPFRLFP